MFDVRRYIEKFLMDLKACIQYYYHAMVGSYKDFFVKLQVIISHLNPNKAW